MSRSAQQSPTPGPGGAERSLAVVSVPRAVAVFLFAGLVVLTVIGVVLALAQRQTATSEAIRDARTLTNLQAEDVVGPSLTSEALVPGPAFDELDRIVRERVLGALIVRVKIWDETGQIVYSDDATLIGQRFELPPEEIEALRSGDTVAEVSDLDDAENVEEAGFGKLLQVYLGVRTPEGQRLLFETYQPYDTIDDASRRMWLTSLPVLFGGLMLLYAVQAPLAYRMARRLQAAQDGREQLLVATLAAGDRERTQIAADLHDGIVQGLAGASYTLSAAATTARAADQAALAETVGDTATSLRRWVRELRSLIVTVTPPALHSQGLQSTLTDLVATLETRGMVVDLEVVGAAQLPELTESLVYRTAQEAVRNIVRHAEASHVEVRLRREGDWLELSVADDGAGFDPAAVDAAGSPRRRGSVGLDLLAALVTSQAGRLDVVSAPGVGTTVNMRVPVAAQPPAALAGAAAR